MIATPSHLVLRAESCLPWSAPGVNGRAGSTTMAWPLSGWRTGSLQGHQECGWESSRQPPNGPEHTLIAARWSEVDAPRLGKPRVEGVKITAHSRRLVNETDDSFTETPVRAI